MSSLKKSKLQILINKTGLNLEKQQNFRISIIKTSIEGQNFKDLD